MKAGLSTGALRATLAASLILAATAAAAHEGGAGGGFVTGFMHPVLGWDHVAAMVAVGLWGAFLGLPAIWILPVAFPVVMAVALSALVIGLMVALAQRPPLWVAALVVAVFALFHGHAHGTEMPSAASPAAYAVGFVIGTGLLHLAGIGLGVLAGSQAGRAAVRAMGAAIAVAGLWFTAGALS
jgi:urease accessory protein